MTCIFTSSTRHTVLSIKDLNIIPRIEETVYFISDIGEEIEGVVTEVWHDFIENNIEITIKH